MCVPFQIRFDHATAAYHAVVTSARAFNGRRRCDAESVARVRVFRVFVVRVDVVERVLEFDGSTCLGKTDAYVAFTRSRFDPFSGSVFGEGSKSSHLFDRFAQVVVTLTYDVILSAAAELTASINFFWCDAWG